MLFVRRHTNHKANFFELNKSAQMTFFAKAILLYYLTLQPITRLFAGKMVQNFMYYMRNEPNLNWTKCYISSREEPESGSYGMKRFCHFYCNRTYSMIIHVRKKKQKCETNPFRNRYREAIPYIPKEYNQVNPI
jgi:hypothetical protein